MIFLMKSSTNKAKVMAFYDLTKDAENDLREMARYTLNKWGKKKLDEYRGGLKNVLKKNGSQ